MTAGLAIATMVGAAMFPLFIRLVWGELVEDFGPIGGWMAAAFIVGTLWSINHGLETPMIHQTGAWVDMAVAAGVGIYTAELIRGKLCNDSLPRVFAAIVGGILAGLVLSFFL